MNLRYRAAAGSVITDDDAGCRHEPGSAVVSTVRSRRHVVLSGLLALTLLSGCESSPIGDKPTGDGYEHHVGACSSTWQGTPIDRTRSKQVSCTSPHDNEVLTVGEFGPDGATDEALREVYAGCGKTTTKLLGFEWHESPLLTRVALPSTARRKGGERWWECTVSYMDDGVPREITGSLFALGSSDVTPQGGNLHIGCRRAGNSIGYFADTWVRGGCRQPHNGEYVTSVTVADGTPYPDPKEQVAALADACRPAIAAAVGVDPARVRLYAFPVHGEDAWPYTLDVRCFAYTGDKTMVGSVIGTGGKGVPW
jgi:hypothetical protein